MRGRSSEQVVLGMERVVGSVRAASHLAAAADTGLPHHPSWHHRGSSCRGLAPSSHSFTGKPVVSGGVEGIWPGCSGPPVR